MEDASMSMAFRPQSISVVATEVARALIFVSDEGASARISTPLLYPGGAMVSVELSRLRGEFLVNDGGNAHREASLLGGERTFLRIAKETAERFGVRFDSDMIFDLNVSEAELSIAVIAVANAAKSAVEATALQLAAAPHADYRAMLWTRLEKLYTARAVSRRRHIRGSSEEWEFDAAVEREGSMSLFEVVPPHSNAVNSAVTKFLDIRDLGEIAPNRIAVLVKKDATPHLTVLARTAQIVSADDPDEVYRQAA
jgi:hypothetical protein